MSTDSPNNDVQQNLVGLGEERGTERLEAFSDGVFAVAITLLVLDISIPAQHDQNLVKDLFSQWPEYLAYMFSFVMIGIYWMNHHHIFKYIRSVDQILMFLNVLLLLWIGLIPFGTGLLAKYIGEQHKLQQEATIFFSSLWFITGVFYSFVWRYAASKKDLLEPGLSDTVLKSLTRDYTLGIVANGIALALAFVNVPLSLTVSFFVTIYFARPATKRAHRPSHAFR